MPCSKSKACTAKEGGGAGGCGCGLEGRLPGGEKGACSERAGVSHFRAPTWIQAWDLIGAPACPRAWPPSRRLPGIPAASWGAVQPLDKTLRGTGGGHPRHRLLIPPCNLKLQEFQSCLLSRKKERKKKSKFCKTENLPTLGRRQKSSNSSLWRRIESCWGLPNAPPQKERSKIA